MQIINHQTEILYTRPDGVEPLLDSFTYTIGDGRRGHATATVVVSDGGRFAPTLIVEPASVTLPVAGDFRFEPPLQPFPELHDRQAADPRGGVDGGDLTLDAARTVTVSLVSETAGFHNSLGFYTLVDGMPTHPQILFPQVDEGVLKGASAHISGLPAGTQFGFFLIQNGAGLVDGHTQLDFRPGDDGHPELVRLDDGRVLPVVLTDSRPQRRRPDPCALRPGR